MPCFLKTTISSRGNGGNRARQHQTQPAHKEEPSTGGGVTPETTEHTRGNGTHT